MPSNSKKNLVLKNSNFMIQRIFLAIPRLYGEIKTFMIFRVWIILFCKREAQHSNGLCLCNILKFNCKSSSNLQFLFKCKIRNSKLTNYRISCARNRSRVVHQIRPSSRTRTDSDRRTRRRTPCCATKKCQGHSCLSKVLGEDKKFIEKHMFKVMAKDFAK